MKEKLSFLLESQFWSLNKIREYQLGKLQSIISHAQKNVPYYRSLFHRVGLLPVDVTTFENFARLPVLNKIDIQNSFQDLIAEGTDRGRFELNSTGGSTGMPLNFYQDGNYVQWADAARLRAWKYIEGSNETEIEAVLWGAVRDIGKGLTFKKILYSLLREGTLPLNTFDLDASMLKAYLKYYNIFRPPIVRGYASSLYYVACYAEKYNIFIHSPRAIISSTEVLHPRMRNVIERAFKCKVFDSYGCREISQIATECEAHNGFHVVFENQYVELDGNDIVVTNLNNYVMPFIRYKVGDLAIFIDTTPCSCGRFSPRIMKLIGRDNDNIELPNGKIINGEFFEFLFFGISSVIQYQIVYKRSIDRLNVKLNLKDESKDAEDIVRKTMLDKYRYTNIDFEYGNNFDKTPTGKLRFVYSVD